MRRRGPRPFTRLLLLLLLAGAGYGAWRFGVPLWNSISPQKTISRSIALPADLETALGPLQVLHLIGDLNADGRSDAVAISALHAGERRVALLLSGGDEYRLAGAAQPLQWPQHLPELARQDLGEAKGALLLTVRLPGGEEQYQAFAVGGTGGLSALDYYRITASARTDRNLVLVDKRLNVLYYYRNGRLMYVARTATGKDRTGTPSTKNNYTPEGTFRILTLQANPSYTSSDGKQSWKGGDPKNPLGTRWMGFSVLPGDSGWIFGIQGTSEPEKIGTWSSNGSVWLTNADAEKLYDLIDAGTMVEIR